MDTKADRAIGQEAPNTARTVHDGTPCENPRHHDLLDVRVDDGNGICQLDDIMEIVRLSPFRLAVKKTMAVKVTTSCTALKGGSKATITTTRTTTTTAPNGNNEKKKIRKNRNDRNDKNKRTKKANDAIKDTAPSCEPKPRLIPLYQFEQIDEKVERAEASSKCVVWLNLIDGLFADDQDLDSAKVIMTDIAGTLLQKNACPQLSVSAVSSQRNATNRSHSHHVVDLSLPWAYMHYLSDVLSIVNSGIRLASMGSMDVYVQRQIETQSKACHLPKDMRQCVIDKWLDGDHRQGDSVRAAAVSDADVKVDLMEEKEEEDERTPPPPTSLCLHLSHLSSLSSGGPLPPRSPRHAYACASFAKS